MTSLRFRNIDVSPAGPVSQWPYEGLVAAIERGFLSDWRRIAEEIQQAPWGRTARQVEEYATYGEAHAVAALLTETVRRARALSAERERAEVARRVRDAIAESGRTARDFASECGTSASRLSTYASGKVDPGASLLVRFERVAARGTR